MPLFKTVLESGQVTSRQKLLYEKRRICERLGISAIPKNGDILSMLSQADKDKFSAVLKSKPVRTLSGVTVVALMTKPFDCPHGVCLFCPGGTRVNTPQSYTGFEPAARRARMNSYDPYLQTQARLKHYLFMGYTPQKVEIIVIGGTFTTLPKDYRDNYILQIYRALNDFPDSNSQYNTDLEMQKRINETSRIRCVTFAVETKPERCGENEIKELLDYGVTRVEMGVQSVYDDVLKRNNRGHSINDVKVATRELRNAAFKVDHHIMLNLPFSDIDKDRETIRRIYTDESLKPDAIKIYPTLVIKGTGLYKMWLDGKHKAYSLDDVVNLIAEAEMNAPRWLRIMRIERDIPSNLIEGGIKITNLRQLVFSRIMELGKKPNDIRSREIGHVPLVREPNLKLKRVDYRAAGGDELFLSMDDTANDALVGFLRLRLVDAAQEALVRELHVYGEQKPLESREDAGFQHKGIGRELLKEAERITSKEYSRHKIRVISGVGVREYYRKEGYKLENDYMVKCI